MNGKIFLNIAQLLMFALLLPLSAESQASSATVDQIAIEPNATSLLQLAQATAVEDAESEDLEEEEPDCD